MSGKFLMKGWLVKRFILILCLATAVGLSFSYAALAADEESVLAADKISIQQSLEDKATQTLSSILGHSKFIVTLNVQLNPSKYETFKETWRAPSGGMATAGMNYTLPAIENEMLPGIPQKQNLETNNTSGSLNWLSGMTKITNRSVSLPSNIFSKISATIFVDKSVSNGDLATIKKMTPVILGMNTRRGDTVAIEKVTLKNKMFSLAGISKNLRDSLFVTMLTFAALFTLIAAMIVLFFGLARKLVHEVAPLLQREEFSPRAVLQEEKKGSEKQEPQMKEEKEKRFSFIKDEHIGRLKYVLASRDPKTIASILLCLNPSVSAEILSQMPTEIKEAVALYMATPMHLGTEALEKLEAEVRSGIDGTVGGIEDFMNIIHSLPDHETNNILACLDKHNPQVAGLVKKLKFTAEDLARLTDGDLERVLSSCETKDISLLLCAVKGGLAEKIKRCLTPEAFEMVNEWTELSKNASKKNISESIRNITQKVRELLEAETIAIEGFGSAEGFEYIIPAQGNVLFIRRPEAPTQNAASAEVAGIVREVEPAAPAFDRERAIPEPEPKKELKKATFDLKSLVELNDDEFEAILNEVSPKVLSIALQNNGEKIREKIGGISQGYLENLKLCDTVLGKQPDWKVEQAIQQIAKKIEMFGKQSEVK